jgi:C-terminal processing protease CtpA/Prc
MKYVLSILLLCFLFSCSLEDDEKISSSSEENTVSLINGIAASGSPIDGMVTIRGTLGNSVDCAIGTNGYFSANVSALTAPFLLDAKGTVNDFEVHYYSYANTDGQVNINQLTHVTVCMAIQNDINLYGTPNASLMDSNDISYYAGGINYLLSASYIALGLEEDFDFLHNSFSANGTGFDLLLDRISIAISNSNAFISDKDTFIPIFIHDMDHNENLYFLEPEQAAELLIIEHCSLFFQKLAVNNYMHDIYYWNNSLPELELSNYPDPESLLEAMRYSKDEWSAIVQKDIFDAYMNDSTYVGLGLYIGFDINSDLRISFVYPDSPADIHGLTRGDIILESNNIPSDQIESQIDSAFGEDAPGEVVNLKVQKSDDSIVNLSIEKEALTITTVLYSTILDVNEESVGYLVFNDFIISASEDLKPVFNHFKENNISELILDLRYNSGGSLEVAKELASLIGGSSVVDKTFCKVQYNENRSEMNKTYQFVQMENSLDIERLFVITTRASVSASEALINCLEPYMDVVVIGTPTSGKPVGMNPLAICDKYLFPITFEVFNAQDEGGYFDGIPVDCYTMDDLSRPFGDREEYSLSEALYFIENNHCSYRKRNRDIIKTKPFPLHGFKQVIGAY